MNAPLKTLQLPTVATISPIMTRKRFAEITGLTDGQLEGMINRGQIPSIRPSCFGRTRVSFVNVAKLYEMCLEDGD